MDPEATRWSTEVAGLRGRLMWQRHQRTGDRVDLMASRDAYAAGLALAAGWFTARLSRPVARTEWPRLAVLAVLGAMWALGLRTEGATEAIVEQAIDDRQLVIDRSSRPGERRATPHRQRAGRAGTGQVRSSYLDRCGVG